MLALEFPASLLALTAGTVSLSLAAFLLAKYRTPLLGLFLVFDSALFLMTASFASGSIARALLWIAEGSARRASALALAESLGLAGAIARGVGATAIAAVLPFFAYGLFGRQPGVWYRRLALGSCAAMAGLMVAYLLAGHPFFLGAAVSGLLFANIALSIVLVARLLRSSALKAPPYAGALKGFIALSACFLPLFAADAFFFGRPGAAPFEFLNDSTVPLYFIIICFGTVRLARRGFDHPPLMEEDKISAYGKDLYGLTDREAEVLEYIVDGYSLKDLAAVLGIAAKTAENHLQSVYRKTGVNNRIQLFQAFQNQRRSG